MSTVLSVAGHTPTIAHDAYLAPTAVVAGRVTLGAQVSVWFGTVLRAESSPITVGAQTNLQDGVIVHTDPDAPVSIGARVTVGHRAVVHGCTVEDDALIGIGAVVLNGARIGAGAVVAAGAVVRPGTEVPPGTLAAGVPARILERELPPVPRPNVDAYLRLAEAYRNEASG